MKCLDVTPTIKTSRRFEEITQVEEQDLLRAEAQICEYENDKEILDSVMRLCAGVPIDPTMPYSTVDEEMPETAMTPLRSHTPEGWEPLDEPRVFEQSVFNNDLALLHPRDQMDVDSDDGVSLGGSDDGHPPPLITQLSDWPHH